MTYARTTIGVIVVAAALVVVLYFAVFARPPRKCRERLCREKRLPHKECGLATVILGETTGGEKSAESGEFPWVALLGVTPEDDPTAEVRWGCGGSLITDQHVLTAAHCVHESSHTYPQKYGRVLRYVVTKVRLGELNTNPNVSDEAKPRDYDVDSITIHNNYFSLIQQNDIALIKLKEKVEFTDYIWPICLPPKELNERTFVDEYPIVVGWGNDSSDFTTDPVILSKTKVKVVETEGCRKNLTLQFPWQIDDNVICAGEKGQNSCQGDSGGPLMYFYQHEDGYDKGRQYVIGVGSLGYGLRLGCGLKGHLGIYTRVPNYKDWILDHLWNKTL